jgi:hypothetical protein
MIIPLTHIAEIPAAQHADAITSTAAAVMINVSPQLIRYWAHNREDFPPVIDNGDARLRLIYFDQNKLDTYFEMRRQNPAEVVEKSTKFSNSLAQQFFKAMPNTARRAGG